jgi:hypothetical protein
MGRGVTRKGKVCGRSGQQIPRVGKVGGKMNKFNLKILIFVLKKFKFLKK